MSKDKLIVNSKFIFLNFIAYNFILSYEKGVGL